MIYCLQRFGPFIGVIAAFFLLSCALLTGGNVHVEYDESVGDQVVKLESWGFGNDARIFGQAVKGHGSASLEFRQTSHDNPAFPGCELELAVDGMPLNAGPTRNTTESEVVQLSNGGMAVNYNEKLSIELDEAALGKLASATRISVKVCDRVHVLSEQQLAAFSEFGRMAFAK